MNDKRDLLVRGCIYLLTALLCMGIFYACWHFVGSRVRLGFPANSMGGAMELPLQLTCNALLSMVIGLLLKGLTLDLPRQIRRKRFWRWKHAQNTN
ncbi:MAG: hypothetical protein ACNJA3_28500 (plasmid) [Pseudomonas rhizophila]|uniref:hypothetical protein n=1 Tax=Pseudomonas rhizophila TaxID=2045200 RepID=UPI003F6BEE90